MAAEGLRRRGRGPTQWVPDMGNRKVLPADLSRLFSPCTAGGQDLCRASHSSVQKVLRAGLTGDTDRRPQGSKSPPQGFQGDEVSGLGLCFLNLNLNVKLHFI